MPKKFAGENLKSTVARARKDAVKAEKREKEAAAKEDAYWTDDDKHVQRKQQRKEEEERKRQQALERKQQNKEAYEADLKSAGGSRGGAFSSVAAGSRNITTKVTLAQLQARRDADEQHRQAEEEHRAETACKLVAAPAELHENLNRLELDGEVATDVEGAIRVLNATTGRSSDAVAVDLHPEKRAKAAYTAFEERRLPELKKAHPTFRLSQLKQLLRKEWLKSTENPLNERILNIIG